MVSRYVCLFIRDLRVHIRIFKIFANPNFYLQKRIFDNPTWSNLFLRTCMNITHWDFLPKFLSLHYPLSYHPGWCLGCQEKWTSSRNYNLFVWSAVFQPKWNDIQKSYKNYQNPLKSYCFLGYFQSLFNFGWKTAAQTNYTNLSGSYCFVWHPSHP